MSAVRRSPSLSGARYNPFYGLLSPVRALTRLVRRTYRPELTPVVRSGSPPLLPLLTYDNHLVNEGAMPLEDDLQGDVLGNSAAGPEHPASSVDPEHAEPTNSSNSRLSAGQEERELFSASKSIEEPFRSDELPGTGSDGNMAEVFFIRSPQESSSNLLIPLPQNEQEDGTIDISSDDSVAPKRHSPAPSSNPAPGETRLPLTLSEAQKKCTQWLLGSGAHFELEPGEILDDVLEVQLAKSDTVPSGSEPPEELAFLKFTTRARTYDFSENYVGGRLKFAPPLPGQNSPNRWLYHPISDNLVSNLSRALGDIDINRTGDGEFQYWVWTWAPGGDVFEYAWRLCQIGEPHPHYPGYILLHYPEQAPCWVHEREPVWKDIKLPDGQGDMVFPNEQGGVERYD